MFEFNTGTLQILIFGLLLIGFAAWLSFTSIGDNNSGQTDDEHTQSKTLL